MSKKQASIESFTFRSEYTSKKQCCAYLQGLIHKLRIMDIPVTGQAYILGENKSVLCNTALPDSTLKKNSQSIEYHFVREGAVRDE
jgi:hypothetical protein